MNAARAHLGLEPIEHDAVYSYVGNGAPELMRRALGEHATPPKVQQALDFFLAYYRDHKLDHTVLYPGVREALDRLLAANVDGVLSTSREVGQAIVDDLGLTARFRQVSGSSFPPVNRCRNPDRRMRSRSR